MADRPLSYVRSTNSAADYFLHCGDSEMPPQALADWAAVRGNNDYYGSYPENLTLDIAGHRFLLTHGHRDMMWHQYDQLAAKANRLGCDICCFGHTHIYMDAEVNGVRLLNPGSLRYNRDRSNPCYMRIELNGDSVKAVRINLPDELNGF